MAINNQVVQQTTAHLDDRLFEIERKKTKTIVHLYKVIASCGFREYWEGQEGDSWSELHGVYAHRPPAEQKMNLLINEFLSRGYTYTRAPTKNVQGRLSNDSTDSVLFIESIVVDPKDLFANSSGQYRYKNEEVIL